MKFMKVTGEMLSRFPKILCLFFLSVLAAHAGDILYLKGGDTMEITSAHREGDFLEVTSKDGTIKFPQSALGEASLRQYFPESVPKVSTPSLPANPSPATSTPVTPLPPIPDAKEVMADLPRTVSAATDLDKERKFTAKPVTYDIQSRMFDSAKIHIEALVPLDKSGRVPDSASNIIFYSAYGGFKNLLEGRDKKPGTYYLWQLCEVYGYTLFTANFVDFKYDMADDHQKCFYYPESHSYEVVFQARNRLMTDFGLRKKKMMVIGESGGSSMAQRLGLLYPDDVAAVAMTGVGHLEPVPEKLDPSMPWLDLYVRGDLREPENTAFRRQMRAAGANILFMAVEPCFTNKATIPKAQTSINYHHAPNEYVFQLLQQFILDCIKLSDHEQPLAPRRWPLVASTSAPFHIVKNTPSTEATDTALHDPIFFPSEDFATLWAQNVYRKIQLPPCCEDDPGLEILVRYPPAKVAPKGILLLNFSTDGLDAIQGDYLDYAAQDGVIVIAADFLTKNMATKEETMLRQTKAFAEWATGVKEWSDLPVYLVGLGTGGRHMILTAAALNNPRIQLVVTKDSPLDWGIPDLSPTAAIDQLHFPLWVCASPDNEHHDETKTFTAQARARGKNVTRFDLTPADEQSLFSFFDKVISHFK